MYTVNLPLVDIPVGGSFPRAAWPAHLTVLGNVHAVAGPDALGAALLRVAAGHEPVEGRIGDEALFGDHGDVLVRLVDSAAAHRLHVDLVAALDGFGLEPELPGAFGCGFRPHITVVPGAPAAGNVRFERLLLARLDGPVAMPLAVFPLAGRPSRASIA